MPYKTIDELPESVRNILPKHAQEIYIKAYNNVWEQYKDLQSGEARRVAKRYLTRLPGQR